MDGHVKIDIVSYGDQGYLYFVGSAYFEELKRNHKFYISSILGMMEDIKRMKSKIHKKNSHSSSTRSRIQDSLPGEKSKPLHPPPH